MFIWEGGRPCSPHPAGWGPWPGKQDPGVALGAGNVASERQRLCVHTPGPGLFRQHSHGMQCAHGECAVQGLLVTSRRGVTLAPIEFQNILSPESRSPISVRSRRGPAAPGTDDCAPALSPRTDVPVPDLPRARAVRPAWPAPLAESRVFRLRPRRSQGQVPLAF